MRRWRVLIGVVGLLLVGFGVLRLLTEAISTASLSSVLSNVRSSPRRAHDVCIGCTHTNGIDRSAAS